MEETISIDKYSAWVRRLLDLKLYSPGGGPNGTNKAWMDHPLSMVKELKGQRLGCLERNQIEWLAQSWSVKAEPYMERDDLHPDAKAAIRQDIAWIRQARICLDRLIEAESKKDGGPHAAPIKSPAAIQPDMLLLTQNQGNGISEPPRADLMDPKFIKSAVEFVANCELARRRLRETDDPVESKKIAGYAQMLATLASTVGLGREFELVGKGLRFEAYYRAGQLQVKLERGRPKKGKREEPSEPDPFTSSDRRLMSILTKLQEEEFEKRVQEGIEKGTLTEQTFRPEKIRGIPRINAKSSTIEEQDPLRYLLALSADVRANPDFYSPQYALKLSTDPRFIENLGPVASVFGHFAAVLTTELRKHGGK